jgi:ribonuclease BN (tRNA processing enzyme)
MHQSYRIEYRGWDKPVVTSNSLEVSLVILRFLGAHNAESRDTRLVSFLVDDLIAVDAGSLVSELTFLEQKKIKAILLSHGHYDHIRAVPAFAFNNSDRTTKVIATPHTLNILSSHLIDGVVYPEFTSEKSFLHKAPIKLIPVEFFKRQNIIDGYDFTAIPVKHPLDAVGFEIVSGDGKRIFYTGDTGPGLSHVWLAVSPELLIVDVTWPNRMQSMAEAAGHMCPEMLMTELMEFRRTKGYYPRVTVIHMSPQHEPEIEEEIRGVAEKLEVSIGAAHEGEELIL